MTKTYITTSIAYANAAPHIGFAWELVLADAEARKRRQSSQTVFFLTGTDEHGQKIYTIAQKQGIPVQRLVDKNSALFERLAQKLNISQDNFIRTSSPHHHRVAQDFWKKLKAAGDIYPKPYQGLYCVGCEAFLLPRELKAGRCPTHRTKPEQVKETNYFFRLTKYQDQLLKIIQQGQVKILPASRKRELLNLIKNIQEDVSFSRPAEKLPWGVDVPGDPSQKIYVWCDALVNYLSGLKNPGFWSDRTEKIHFIGKDILRFHGSIWLAMLLSAKLALPNEVRVHGWITHQGQKMSKSLGNVVDPLALIQKYGTDPVRFYLLKEIPQLGDGDWSEERFRQVYNSQLANELGNLVQRSLVLFSKVLPKGSTLPKVQPWQRFNLGKGSTLDLEQIWREVRKWNNFISKNKLWEANKNQTGNLKKLAEGLGRIAYQLAPYLPETSQKIQQQLKALKGGILFPKFKP